MQIQYKHQPVFVFTLRVSIIYIYFFITGISAKTGINGFENNNIVAALLIAFLRLFIFNISNMLIL